jgi:hypothetical protein
VAGEKFSLDVDVYAVVDEWPETGNPESKPDGRDCLLKRSGIIAI